MGRLGALDWQTLQISFGSGLFTKTDARFSSPPTLDIARDIQFEEIGGIQTRPPFAAMSNTIFGGGTLSACRRLAVVNGELCVLTDTALYSWNAQQSAWVLRGTHLAVAVAETPRLVTAGDQVDADRAELNGTIVTAWTEATSVYAAAVDKTTGSMLVSPTAVSTAVGRPRLVALSTRILLFVDDGLGDLTVRAIDPANPATGIASAGTGVLFATFNGAYDVVRVGATDQCVGACRQTPPTVYTAFTVTAGLTIATSGKGRPADGPISVANSGTTTQIVRASGTNIQGDLLTTSTLADVFFNQPIGTTASAPVNQIAVEYKSATTAVAFWTGFPEISNFTTYNIKSNTVTTASVVGAESIFRRQVGIASRAFAYSGHAYVWTVFASDSGTSATGNTSAVRAQLQNTYFLYRDDGLLVAQCVRSLAGGFSFSQGHLPGVQLASGSTQFSWCAIVRRRIAVGAQAPHTAFGARSPVDVTFTFDSNNARRSAQAGRTLYIASSIPLSYDGQALVETGFLIYPWYFEPQNFAAGNLGAGTYTWVSTMRWQNAQGEIDRSTTATGMQLAVGASRMVVLNYQYLYITLKVAPRPPSIDMWRSAANAPLGAPFYLVTSQDPNAGIVNNGYVSNQESGGALTPLPDNFADATLTNGKETWPENGDVLEFMAPAGHSIVVPSDDRLYIGGLLGNDAQIAYSRARSDREVASFHEVNTADVPPVGGSITALWIQDGVLYVGRQSAIYALPGVPFDNTGQGQGLGPAQIVSLDVGPVSQEAQCLTPLGTVLKTGKGFYLMDRGRNLKYIGAAVNAFDGDTVLSMAVMTSLHEVRVLTNSRMLTWTYTDAVDLVDAQTPGGMGQWSERTIADGLDALLWNGGYVYLTSTGPKQEQASYSGLTYGLDVETSWIKMNELEGYGKVAEIIILGEFRSACLVRVRVGRDYAYDGAGNVVYTDDKAWAPSPTTVGSVLQVRHSPSASNGNCEALKVRITAVAELTRATLVTSSALSPTVTTSGSAWAATWAATNTGTPGVSFPGLMGNSITMTIAFASGSTPSIDVRDHLTWNASLGRWRELVNNVGVLVTGTNASTTVAAMETAIAAATRLCTLQTPDGTPSKLVAIATLAGTSSTGAFSGGAYTSPTGEALKLTAIALRVGLKPGLYTRLPAAQKE